MTQVVETQILCLYLPYALSGCPLVERGTLEVAIILVAQKSTLGIACRGCSVHLLAFSFALDGLALASFVVDVWWLF